jgi:hypothetical protein
LAKKGRKVPAVPFSKTPHILTGGALTAPFELFFKSNLSLPRLGALRCAPCISRPCWGKASFGARLAARFLPILRRVQRPNQSVYKNGWPLTATKLKKSSVAVCKASREQYLRSEGKILPKKTDISMGRKLTLNKSNFTTVYR